MYTFEPSLKDTLKGLDTIKSGAEKVVPGLKQFDTGVGHVIDSTVDASKDVLNKTSKTPVGKVAGALSPKSALKDFDMSKGTASIGENIASKLVKDPSANPSQSTVNKVLRPSDKTRAAQAEVQKDLD